MNAFPGTQPPEFIEINPLMQTRREEGVQRSDCLLLVDDSQA